MTVSEYYSWFKDNWAKIGLVLSIYFFVFSIIFVKKENFPAFLILISTPLYMIHETEEYLFPGGFANFFNRYIFNIKEDEGPLNKDFIFYINIFLIWIILPVFGFLSCNSLYLGLWIPYFTIFAGIAHIVLAVKAHKLYNPGLIVSLILNIPVGILIVLYFYNNSYIENLIFNIHCVIGLSVNLLLPVFGIIVLKKFKKNLGNIKKEHMRKLQ